MSALFPNQFNCDAGSSLIALTAQAAATLTSDDLPNMSGSGVNVVVDITAATSMTLTVTIQGKDVVSGKYYTILASTALAATGTTVLSVHPALTASANVAANALLPATWRVQAVVTGTSVTATIGASVVR